MHRTTQCAAFSVCEHAFQFLAQARVDSRVVTIHYHGQGDLADARASRPTKCPFQRGFWNRL